MPTPNRLAHAGLALTLAAGLTLLGGCSGGGSESVASVTRAGSSGAQKPAADSAGPKEVSSVPVMNEQKLARTATLSLQVDDVAKATAQVRAVNVAQGGFILSENIGTTDDDVDTAPGVSPKTYAALVISVPSDKLDSTLDELQRLGTVIDRRSDTENVTGEYVDVQARVGSMRKAVTRIQDLIDKTADIDQLVKLERELSTRQADLEAIEARLQELDRSTTRSPITINLTTDPALIENAAANPATGFAGGLKAGWKAFVNSLAALFTLLGAVLPFALFLAVIGWPIRLVWRRLKPRRRVSSAVPAGGPWPSAWPAAGAPVTAAASPTPAHPESDPER